MIWICHIISSQYSYSIMSIKRTFEEMVKGGIIADIDAFIEDEKAEAEAKAKAEVFRAAKKARNDITLEGLESFLEEVQESKRRRIRKHCIDEYNARIW